MTFFMIIFIGKQVGTCIIPRLYGNSNNKLVIEVGNIKNTLNKSLYGKSDC